MKELDLLYFHEISHPSSYVYNLCPFQNITQKEDTTRISGYHGVLGIWSDWIIENDTFAGMIYSKGEKCGLIDRQAKVQIFV